MDHNYKSSDIEFPDQKIEFRDMRREVETSFIEYSMSVITSRALPDVRDGMKPGQRRILYAMYEDNLTHDKPFRKSATTVGNVLGRYHPHGDSAVYGTMVRMAQDFSLRYTLVEGHGNFGSVDGDPPAAYRYTEARMSRIAGHMMSDIEKNVVPMTRNFDNTRDEPTVLPSRFPNLLVNGSVGIAVGMATNIPPHNLTEVIDGTVYRIDNPECSVDELYDAPEYPASFNRILAYVRENYTEKLTLEGLSTRFGMSKQHIIRMFRRCLGTTATGYINDLKLSHAPELLCHSTLNVSEIAAYLGFTSAGYFTRLFRKKYSVSPTAYAAIAGAEIKRDKDARSGQSNES